MGRQGSPEPSEEGLAAEREYAAHGLWKYSSVPVHQSGMLVPQGLLVLQQSKDAWSQFGVFPFGLT